MWSKCPYSAEQGTSIDLENYSICGEKEKSHYKMGNCPEPDRELTSVSVFFEKTVEKDCL